MHAKSRCRYVKSSWMDMKRIEGIGEAKEGIV
jgi:hypothetical protein